MNKWHTMTGTQVMERLGTSEQGLDKKEVKHRLTQGGENRLRQPKKESLLIRFVSQLKDPMILVLLGAAVLSLIASGGHEWVDSVIIMVIVVVNTWVSITQEDNATKALEALEQMTAPKANVMRAGQWLTVDATQLAVGDVISLQAGDLVPADGRILSCAGLKTDESAMTGESVTVEKEAVERLAEETPLAERRNMVLSATVVTNGRCLCVVTATGMNTQVGQIAELLLEQSDGTTPLQVKMAEISKTLSFVCLCVCGVMFGIGLLQGKDMLDMFMTAVSLAVAAIPEGLPAIVTIVLALGVQRMAGKHAIIKKLPAVETLGSAAVICSDKTGTLTQNKMTVVEVWGNQKSKEEVLTLGTLCNDATATSGDPTERAFVKASLELGVKKRELEHEMPRVDEIPFDSTRKLMSTLHRLPSGGFRLVVKGAPDVMLSRCNIDPKAKEKAVGVNDAMAGNGLRVLAVAFRDFPEKPTGMNSQTVERELTFAGLVGMIDPPREEVKQAVAECYQAGVRPVMITGDHKLTAVSIAKELGIYRMGDHAITGAELDFMPQSLLEAEVEQFSVYARVSPEHKMRIIQAWQSRGKIVAMTGDGVNDAPALKTADIGCAMGITGTDVAKGASDMILTDDNFATIVSAVSQGRSIYANIKKAVHYLLSCNIGEIITILTATIFNFRQMPLVPVQLLWLNLVTDSLPALALGVEPPEENLMEQLPRSKDDGLFDHGFGRRILWQGVMIGGLTLLAYGLGFVLASGERADAVANTMAFATLTLCQLFHAFDVRSDRQSLFQMGWFTNKAMNKAFLVGIILQLSVLCLPMFQGIFSTVTLRPLEMLTILVLALVPVVVCETVKRISRPKEEPMICKKRVTA